MRCISRLRAFLFAAVAVPAVFLAMASDVCAADITYPSLTAATTVQDTDLLATWRSSGPLTKLNASVFATYVQTKISSSFLVKTNNLSDVGSASVARTNLGLGTASTYNIGTSGGNVGVLNGVNTWGGVQTFSAGLSSTTGSFSGTLTASGGVTGNLTGNVTGNLTGAVTGNASTATALATGGTISITGDLTYTSPTFTGSSVTAAGTLATVNGNVGSFGSAAQIPVLTVNAKGLVTAVSTAAITGIPTQTGYAGAFLTTNGSAPSWALGARGTISASSGGCALIGGKNIASCTRLGAGHYELSLSTAMADANFVFTCTAQPASQQGINCSEDGAYRGTNTVAISIYNNSAFGDYAAVINVMIVPD